MKTIYAETHIANRFKAFREKKALGTRPEFQPAAELRKKDAKLHRVNTHEMLESDAPVEVSHQLIDYRNGNEVLASNKMDRLKAAKLNSRLKDTGFAWAVKTGY